MKKSEFKSPFVHKIDPPRMMEGKGAPRDTIFGVLGETKMDPYMRSLGGLVHDTKTEDSSKEPKLIHPATKMNTERHITGPPAKTHISGSRYGQVPYPGQYMGTGGERLS